MSPTASQMRTDYDGEVWREVRRKRVSRTPEEMDVGTSFEGDAVREMEDRRPSSVGPAGAGAKPPCAALAEDRRGERQGNGSALTGSGGDQEDVPEAPGQTLWQ